MIVRRARIFVAGGAIALGACASSVPAAINVPTANIPTTVLQPTATTIATPECNGVSNQQASFSYKPLGPLPSPNALAAGSFMAAIKAKGRLVVGTSADVKLFGARNPFTGQIEGFDVDMLKEVAHAIFGVPAKGQPEKIEFKVITYAQRIPFLQNRSVDIVGHTMTITCARWNRVAFSAEYFAASQRILVRNDNTKVHSFDDLNGQKVCVAKGSTNIVEIAKHRQITAVAVDELGECLVKFQRGDVSAITGDDTVLRGFAAQDKYALVTDQHLTEEPYGLAIAKDHPEFVRFVNAILERMHADGSWNRIYCAWLPCNAGVPNDAQPTPVYGR